MIIGYTNGIYSLIQLNDAIGRAYIICMIWPILHKHDSRTIIGVRN